MTLVERAYDVVEAEVVELPGTDVVDVVEALDALDSPDGVEPVDALVVDALALDTSELAVDADVVEVVELEPAPDGDAKPERHLRIAPDSVRRRRRVRVAAAGAAVTISATLFAVVGFNVELAQHQIQLQHLQEQLQSEQQHYYDLRKEVAERSSPQSITKQAEHIGLVETTPSYLQAALRKLPPQDQTGETNPLKQIHDNAGGSLGPVQ
jgi:hypothetical protein